MATKLPTITKGDALVAPDATIAGGDKVLRLKHPRFTPAHEGMKIAIRNAGPLVNGYRQAKTTQIDAVHSPTELTIRDASEADVTDARIVWGSDHTQKFQNVLLDLGSLGGGVLYLDGFYLVEGVSLNRAIETTAGPCHNRIMLVGSSWATAGLEQWNSDAVYAKHQALIAIGYAAEAPEQDPNNDRVQGVVIKNLSLRQLPNMTEPCAVLATYAAKGLRVEDVVMRDGSYEIFVPGGHSIGVRAQRIRIENGGRGGPARDASDSAFNVLCPDVHASDFEIIGCGQGCEISSHRGRFERFVIDIGTGPLPAGPLMGVNLGSTSQGIWENELVDFTVRNYPAAISISNVSGTINRTRIVRPRIRNGSVLVRSGKDANDPSVEILDPVERDAVIHGRTLICGPEFTYDEGHEVSAPFIFGELRNPQAGKEEVIVERPSVYLPRSVTTAPAFAVITDYSAPVRFVGSRVYGPSGAKDIGAFRLDMGNGMTPLSLLRIDDHQQTYDWSILPPTASGIPAIKVPANTSYSR